MSGSGGSLAATIRSIPRENFRIPAALSTLQKKKILSLILM
jgi:hypothetical protein